MHELAITQDLVEAVVAQCGGRRVRRVVVIVGALAAVLPDAMRFCFDICVEGTELEGATLEIEEGTGQELSLRGVEVV